MEYYPPAELDETTRDILFECFHSTKKFCQVFMPEDFNLPFSSLHDQIFDLIDHSKARQIVIAAPRGIGKTSIACALTAKYILYRATRFVAYLSKSETAAMMQTENIKLSLVSDEGLSEMFGDIRVNDGNINLGKLNFSKKAWVANGFNIVVPRGGGQQIRGLKWIRYRPDLFIFDDLEDDEEIENEENRKKLKQWFYGAAIKARPMSATADWRMIYIDTIKHEDALIVELLGSKHWESLELSICDSNYKTLAPDFKPQVELDAELEDHREQHIMDVFAREYMSQPISKEDAAFKGEYFRYYNEDDEDFKELLNSGRILSILLVDPAKTAKLANAESGLVIWGIDWKTGTMYVRDVRGEHFHPDQLYAAAFEMAGFYNVVAIGLEVTSLNEFITYPFRDYMLRDGRHYEVVELKARRGEGEYSGRGKGKIGRVASLVSYYRRGLVIHNKANCGPLEQQLLSFPRAKRWDVMDAAAYVVEMLEKGMIYFPGSGPDERMEDVEMEYEDLDDEKVDVEMELMYDEPEYITDSW